MTDALADHLREHDRGAWERVDGDAVLHWLETGEGDPWHEHMQRATAAASTWPTRMRGEARGRRDMR